MGDAVKRSSLRRTPMKRTVRDTGPSDVVKEDLLVRARGCCELCGTRLHDGMEYVAQFSRHHRRPRGSGGSSVPWINSLSNLLLVCGSATSPGGCHLRIESDRQVALDNGWLVSYAHRPSSIPVLVVAFPTPVLLTDDGEYVEAP